MYHRFYGLTESPFALTPDPKYLFLTETHKEALASVIYGVQERKGFVLILGEVGTGKTTLIRHILGQLGESVKTVYLFNAVVSVEELLSAILRDLEIPCQGRGRGDMINALNGYLLQETSAGRYVVLIVDEAQNLAPSVLEEIRLLSNLETAHHKLLQVVLVGQPELGEKLGRSTLRALRQRIGLIAELRPLTYAETVRYVDHRLVVAGHEGTTIFTRRALRRIHRVAGGIPRLINVLCDKALVLGYAAGAVRVKARLVAAVEKDWRAFGTGRGWRLARPLPAGARGRQRPLTVPRGFRAGLIGVATAALLVLAVYEGHRWLPWSPLQGAAATALATAPNGDQRQSAQDVATTVSFQTTILDRGKTTEEVLTPGADSGDASQVVAAAASQAWPAPPVEITVRSGDTLAELVAGIYGRSDFTILDFVKMANVEVNDIDWISAGQQLRFPAFHVGAMVRREKEKTSYRLHVVTVPTTETAAVKRFQATVARLGRRAYVEPVNLSRDRTMYRVMVGDFPDREQAETFSRTLEVWSMEPPRGG